MTTPPPTPEETEDEKRMRQTIASMRGGIIPSLNETSEDDKEACVLSEETLDRRDHGVEMMENIAKMRDAQHGREAFLLLARGEENKVDLDVLVDLFGQGAVRTDQEYCKHCAKTIWFDEQDQAWRHREGENVTCVYGGDLLAEPVVQDDDIDTGDITIVMP